MGGSREDWLDQALADATAPCPGARGPRPTQIRPQPGRPALAQPQYRLADYLEQTGPLGHGAAQAAPASLWDVFLQRTARQRPPSLRSPHMHGVGDCTDMPPSY